MKYIIDDSDIQSVLHAYDQNEVMDVFEWLTPVPELPVKPWRERMEGSGLYQAADTVAKSSSRWMTS